MATALTVILSILILAFVAAYLLIIGRFISGWDKISVFIPSQVKPSISITVIIAARDEEKMIGRCLTAILAQDYPKHLYEVIVIDDHSTDRTSEIVKSFEGVKLIVLNLGEQFNSYKKKAIAEGIKQSSGDLIVTTDADCVMGPNWLSTIANYQQKNQCNMVSSPVSFFEEKSWFERIQTAEFSFISGTGAGAIGMGMPFSCNGANLAYRRSIFEAVGGFQGIDHLASGDDELLMHKIDHAFPGTIGFLKSREAIVYTHAKPNLKEFLSQRKRWVSKSVKYRNKVIVVTSVAVWAFNAMLLVGLLSAFFVPAMREVLAVTLVLKFLVDWMFFYRIFFFFGRRDLLRHFLSVEFLYMIYVVFIGISANSGKYTWKGRSVH